MMNGKANSLAKAVRHERVVRGLSQQQLSDASGVSVRTVQRVEQGKPCALSTVRRLSDAMNLENLELVNAWASGTPLGRQCTEPGRMSGLLAILLALPGLVFVALNVSYYELGLGFPGRLLESDVWNAMIVHEFAMPVLIGGTLLGFVFGARGVFCLPTRREKSAIIVERLVLNLYWLQWVAVSIASFVLLAFFSYLVFENMR